MKQLISATFIVTLGFTFAIPIVAQNPPAETYQPGSWQPVARVDLKRPVKIQVVNQTDLPIEYDFTTSYQVPPQPIKPEQSIVLEEQFPLPAYLLINPSSFVPTPAAGATPDLKFNVTVSKDNMVTITVVIAGENDPGNTTFNLHETGAIYVY